MIRYIYSAISVALTVLWYMSPTPEGVSLAIAPLAIAGIGLGVNLLGKAFGSNTTTTQFDQATIEQVIAAIRRVRETGFVPDEGAFNENIELQVEGIFAQAGVNREALEAEFSSRNVNRSPGAIEALIRQVSAPAIRAAGSAVVQGKLGFQQFQLQAKTSQNQILNQLYQILAGLSKRTVTGPNQLGAGVADLGQFAFEYGLGKELGLFGDDDDPVPREQA